MRHLCGVHLNRYIDTVPLCLNLQLATVLPLSPPPPPAVELTSSMPCSSFHLCRCSPFSLEDCSSYWSSLVSMVTVLWVYSSFRRHLVEWTCTPTWPPWSCSFTTLCPAASLVGGNTYVRVHMHTHMHTRVGHVT